MASGIKYVRHCYGGIASGSRLLVSQFRSYSRTLTLAPLPAPSKGKYVDALLRLLQSNTDPKAKAIVAIIRPPKKTAAAHKPAPTRAANGAARAVNGGGPAASVSVAEPTAAAIHATGATRTSITPTKKGGFSNGDEPLSMSTPLKPPKFTDESDAASLGAISDQSETFHDSIDTVDASALAGADANGVTSTETTPVPGPAAADGDSEVARTLDNLQRELNRLVHAWWKGVCCFVVIRGSLAHRARQTSCVVFRPSPYKAR